MGLLAEKAAQLRAVRAVELSRCPVGALLRTLPDDDRASLEELLAQDKRDTPAGIIIAALKEAGYQVAFDDTAIQGHRRGIRGGRGCKCQP